MLTMIKPVIIVITVLVLLPLILSEPLLSTPMFGQLCILLFLIYGFGHLLTGMTCPTFIRFASILLPKVPVPSFISWIKIQGLDAFRGIATIIASIFAIPHCSSITAVLAWTLSQGIGLFLGTSVHVALFVPFHPGLSRCRNCSTKYGPEEGPTVAKGEDTRLRDTNTLAAGQSPCGSSRSGSSVTDSLACTYSVDAGSSSSQDSADFNFDANSTWDSDATSATLLSDSDICSIAARFNHALVKKRFCVEYSIFCTPRSQLATEVGIEDAISGDTNDSGSGCSREDTFLLLGDLLTASFSSTSIVAQSPAPSRRLLVASPNCFYLDLSSSPTGIGHTLESVFSTSFTAVARATAGSRSAPVSRRSSFSSNAPLFRPLSLFASSTSSDVSLADTSPSPSRPFSIFGSVMLLPAGGPSSAPTSSSLSDTFFEAPVDPSSPPSEPALNARFSRFTSLAHSPADAPTPAAPIAASLSAWYLAEGRPVADGFASRPLRIFGVPVEDLPACSYSVSSSSGDFSPKDEAYLRAALGLHEPTSEPRRGFCTAPGGPRRYPRGSEWYGWVFPGRAGEQKPTFVPEEIPPQAPYNEDELAYLQMRWGFYPTPV